VAISLLLPVVSTMEPNLLDRAMRNTPRIRAWMFSSVVSSGRPLNSWASDDLKASNSGTMEISS
jgi:hypothetical protein